jgi:hypothetical protein
MLFQILLRYTASFSQIFLKPNVLIPLPIFVKKINRY